MQTINFEVDDDYLVSDLEQIAQRTGRSVSAVIEEAVRARIDRMWDDSEDYADAVEGWNAYVADGMRGTTLEEFEKETSETA